MKTINALKIFGRGTFVAVGKETHFQLVGKVRKAIVYEMAQHRGRFLIDVLTGQTLTSYTGRVTLENTQAIIERFLKENNKTADEGLEMLLKLEVLNADNERTK